MINKPSGYGYFVTTEIGPGCYGDSKLGGIAYIPKDEKWPVCKNCKREMVLLLQLNLSSLPKGFTGLPETGFFQIFSCYYKDPTTSEKYYNPHTNQKKLEHDCKDHLDILKPFNDTFYMRFIKNTKLHNTYNAPPWIESYHLKLQENKVFETIIPKKNKLGFKEGERYFSDIVLEYHGEKIIKHWEKMKIPYAAKDSIKPSFLVSTLQDLIFQKIGFKRSGKLSLKRFLYQYVWEGLNFTKSYKNNMDYYMDFVKKGGFDFLGQVDGYFFDKVPSCPDCKNTMSLLHEFDGEEYDNRLGVFYCENHIERMSCHELS